VSQKGGLVTEPNYVRKLRAMIESGQIQTAAGGAVVVDVAHDSWCAIFKGKRCDCDPEIRVRPVVPRARAEA
jgi:hypothetical protein